MKTMLLMVCAILFFAIATCTPQSVEKQIVWEPNAVADSVIGWSVYIETVDTDVFILQDGMTYTTTIDTFYQTDVLNTGQTGEVVFDVTLPLDNKFRRGGIIAYNNSGVPSPVGVTETLFLKGPPNKPNTTHWRDKP